MKFLYLCLIVLFTFFYSSVSAQKLLSLEESIQLGIQNHYSIQISKKRELQALNDNTPGNAGFLPTITGTLNKNYTISGLDQEFFGGLRPPLVQSGVNSNSGNAGVAMVWTLYDGKGMFILKDRFKELQNLGAKQTETAIENLISLISSSYYDLIRQNLRVNNFKKGLEISNDSYLNTKISYNTLLVRNHQEEFNVDSKIDLLPKLNLPELKEFALKQNPILISALLTKKITDLDTKSIQSLQMPQIDLLAGYNMGQVNNGAGFGVQRGTSDVLNYGLRATINIFDGYNQKRRVQNAKINAEIAQMQIDDLKNSLISTLERAFVTYENALNLISLETENYAIAKQNIDIAFDRFKVGIATSYELREVQRNAVSAETRLIETKFAAKAAEIELIRLSGNLL